MSNEHIQEQLDSHLASLAKDEINLNLLIEISDIYIQLADWSNAEKYLTRASAIDPKATLALQGLLNFNQGEFTQAQEFFAEALSDNDSPIMRYNLGFTYYITSDLEKAWEALSPLLEDDRYPEAQLLMARILHRQDELEQATSLVEHAVKLNPQDAEALGFLGLLYFDLSEEELAKEAADKALAINPECYDAQLVDVMLRLMNQQTTPEEVEALLAINPQDSRLWFALGNTYMTQGNLEAAEQTLSKAIELYPEFYDCHIALAWCQLLNDHLNEAHETYQNAVELVDSLADGWGGLALIYALNQDMERALQLIERANELNPGCFLTELAETVCLNLTSPQNTKDQLSKALKDTNLPPSEKLALIMAETSFQ